MDCGQAICCTFLPGDAQVLCIIALVVTFFITTFFGQVVIGTKNGELQIFDTSSSSLVATVQAHVGTVWSMHMRADGRTLMTGGADKDVKFWDLIPEEEQLLTIASQTSF